MRNFCCNSTSTIHRYKDMYKRMASRFHKLRTFREREKKKKGNGCYSFYRENHSRILEKLDGF